MGADGKGFYVESSQAVKLLEERRDLRVKVENWWKEYGFVFPDVFLQNGKVGFISRHLATARYEDCAFILMAERLKLTCVWSTYVGDKFIDRSPVKYSYVAPRVVTGFGKNNTPIVKRIDLVHPKKVEKLPLKNIVTDKGIGLVEWHQKLLETIYPGAQITDPSDIYLKLGGARGYYPLLLSLAVAHGVFFEDFHGGETGEELRRFTKGVFEPAFQEIKEKFGVAPIIVPLPWWQELGYYVDEKRYLHWKEDPILKKDVLILNSTT